MTKTRTATATTTSAATAIAATTTAATVYKRYMYVMQSYASDALVVPMTC